MNLENLPYSESGKRMMSYVSADWYEKSYVGKWLYQVMGMEFDEVWEIINSLPEQAFPETATWGLMYHEMKYGLPTDESRSIESRRDDVIQKRDLRKPMNPYAIETLISVITGRKCSVKDSNEDPDIPENTLVIRIEDLNGASALLISKVISKLNEVKQSHVVFELNICASAVLEIRTSKQPWKKVAVSAGTKPGTSTGVGFYKGDIDLETSQSVFRNVYIPAGDFPTGSYPEESTGYHGKAETVLPEVSAVFYQKKTKICGGSGL